MSNIRILYNNVADSATIVASTTSASLVADNMKTDVKSEIHRSTGTSVNYQLDWSASVKDINCVILPCTNLSSTATIRIRCYDVSLVEIYDSDTITAVPGWNLELGGAIHDVNSFAFGNVSKVAVWFPSTETGVSRIIINLVDTSNTAGFIDCSRILTGVYWEPLNNVENGVQLSLNDDSIISQSNAGDLVVDRGFIRDKISFNYALLAEADRAELTKIIKNVGTHKNFFVSVFPSYTEEEVEHDYMLYGKRSNNAITYKIFGYYNSSMEIISW